MSNPEDQNRHEPSIPIQTWIWTRFPGCGHRISAPGPSSPTSVFIRVFTCRTVLRKLLICNILGTGTSILSRPPPGQICDDFWTSFWYSTFPDVGANLDPTSIPTWYQNPQESGPRGLQSPSQLASCFGCPVVLILEASWVNFVNVSVVKLNAKLIEKVILEGKGVKVHFLVLAEAKIKN